MAAMRLLTENQAATLEGSQNARANSTDIRNELRPDNQVLIEC